MNGHPQSDEEFDLYALGALDADEAREMAAHLEACRDCARRLDAARGRMAALGLAAPPETPSSVVRERLQRQIHAGKSEQPASSFSRLQRWLAPALALALLALAIGLAFESARNRELVRSIEALRAQAHRQEMETARARAVLEVLTAADTLRVTLVAGAARPVPQGKAFYHPRKGLVFYATNLPALPTGRSYQLWLVPVAGNPLSAGVFPVDASGNGSVLLPDLPAGVAAKAFAVTVEPEGGVPQPTGPKILVGLVS